MTSSLEMERAYSYFGTSRICHSLTYLDTYHFFTAKDPHGAKECKTCSRWWSSKVKKLNISNSTNLSASITGRIILANSSIVGYTYLQHRMNV